MQSHFRWSLNDQRHPFERFAFAESGQSIDWASVIVKGRKRGEKQPGELDLIGLCLYGRV
jgi:hypothetical protein